MATLVTLRNQWARARGRTRRRVFKDVACREDRGNPSLFEHGRQDKDPRADERRQDSRQSRGVASAVNEQDNRAIVVVITLIRVDPVVQFWRSRQRQDREQMRQDQHRHQTVAKGKGGCVGCVHGQCSLLEQRRL